MNPQYPGHAPIVITCHVCGCDHGRIVVQVPGISAHHGFFQAKADGAQLCSLDCLEKHNPIAHAALLERHDLKISDGTAELNY